MLNVVKNNFQKDCIISIIILQSTMAFSFEMTNEGMHRAIQDYYLIHTQYDNYPVLVELGLGIDQEDFFNRVTEMVRKHSDVFNYIAEAQTDLEILPYIEKYNTLKMRFTGQSINPNIKVLLVNNPMSETHYNESFSFSGICDEFTRTVFLERSFWNYHKNNLQARESLLFHELGHCDLIRKHDDGFNDVDDVGARQPYFLFMDLNISAIFSFSEVFNRKMNRQCSQESMERYIRREGYPPANCHPSVELYYYEHILNSDLSKVFEEMYRELFSIQNTLNGVHIKPDPKNFVKRLVSYDYRSFESIRIPVLKHLTIGPAIVPHLKNFYNTQIDTRREVSHSIRRDQLY